MPQVLIGPFDSEIEFSQAMMDHYDRRHRLEPVDATEMKGHRPTFCHGDFQRKNVLIRNRPASTVVSGEKDVKPEYDVVLIDWEFSAWYLFTTYGS